jgi:hypothetical protein
MTDTQPVVPAPLTPEQMKRRRRNSVALGLVLALLVVIFYALTVAKMGGGIVTQRDL